MRNFLQRKFTSAHVSLMLDIVNWRITSMTLKQFSILILVLLHLFLIFFQVFREHNIDGSALPLLTEDHLTLRLGLKLGPALKLRSLIAKKLGPSHADICVHCAHCNATNKSNNSEDQTLNGSDHLEDSRRSASRNSSVGEKS